MLGYMDMKEYETERRYSNECQDYKFIQMLPIVCWGCMWYTILLKISHTENALNMPTLQNTIV
jgi:hypothetical protein